MLDAIDNKFKNVADLWNKLKENRITFYFLPIKDMGLTDKALDDLVEIGAEGLADDASDEDIAAKVDSLVPYAKAMQGEITRKTQRPKPQSKKTQSNDEGEDEGGNDDEAPEWFKPFQKKLTDLETENAALKSSESPTT